MSKINELSMAISELRKCSETLTGVADILRDLFSSSGEAPTGEVQQAVTETRQPELAKVRAVLAEKSGLGFTAAVRELLLKYGAPRLSEINPAKYAQLLADAEALGHE